MYRLEDPAAGDKLWSTYTTSKQTANMSKNDPMAPNQRATILQIVRNKNNLEELMLRRRMDEYRKTLSIKMGDIEQERLDVFDFIKQLKLCESDTMDEYKK